MESPGLPLPGTSAAAAGSAAAPEPRRLENAARDFEALMISELLRAARMDGSAGWLQGEDAAADSAFGLAQEQLARAMAGGLGIARLVTENLGPSRSSSAKPGPVPPRP